MAGQLIKRGEKVWLIRVFVGRDETGKRKYVSRTVHGTKKQAEAVLTEQLDKRNKDLPMTISRADRPRPKTSPLLKDHLSHWLEVEAKPSVREATSTSYKWIIDTYIEPEIGSIRLDKLEANYSIIEKFYAGMLARGLSPRTVRYAHSVLAAALKRAIKDKLITTNPCGLCTLPKKKPSEMQYFTADEVKAFLAAARPDRFYPLFLLAIETGMRPGEYLALQWKDINFEAGTLAVRRSLKKRRGRGEGFYFTEPKTDQAKRSIPLSASLLAELRNHRRAQAENIMARRDHYQDNGLVFPNEVGEPMLRENLTTRHFNKIVKDAKVPRIRFYDLRHTMATLLLTAGVHPKVVQERLGHSTSKLTLDTYSHVIPSMQQGATESLERIMMG